MSQVLPTSKNFEKIFTAALEVYKQQTKKDIASHPLAAQLQSCDSPSAIITVLRIQIDQSQSADEKWTKWLDPTVNVLYAFSTALGNGAALVFPPANAIFAGIGVLLQAIKDVRAGQDTLADLFCRMEFFFHRLEKYIDVRPSAAMTDIIVKIMVEVISILGIVTKEVRQGRTRRYLKKLIGRKDVENALQRLDKLTQEEARLAAAEALTITRGIDDTLQGVNHKVCSVFEGVKENGVAIKQVVDQVDYLNRNKLRKDLRKWITPADPSINYNTASSAHRAGTAMWCTEGTTLADWKTSGSLLWIHGKPGSGKSILSSVIIRDIESQSDTGSARMAYFFFDFKDTGKQDSRALLSSLLVQLSDQSDQCCDVLIGLHSAHQNGSRQPTVDSLAQCFKDMLTTMEQVPIYLIVDALDECPKDLGIPSARENVLKLLSELVALRLSNLRLCVTSRPEFDIRTKLEPLATLQVSLHDESGQKQDIVDYVSFVVRSDERMKRWRENDKNMVIEKLTEKADGMFRWVFCQLEVLRHCFPANLRRTLEELPKSLDETYKRILNGINNSNQEHAYRLLQCLAVARSPLRVEELAEVLAVDLNPGGIPKLNTDWRWEDQEEAVLSACSSLVSVIGDHHYRVVQFSHFSVKEFLTSDRLASCTEEVSRFHIAIEPSHAILAQACLGILLRLDDHSDEDSAERIHLFRYAAEYWYQHAQVGDVELRIKDAIDYFFDMDKPHFSAWVRIEGFRAGSVDDLLRASFYDKPRAVPLPAAPLYFAAWRGLHGLVERLTVKYPEQVNHFGGVYGTPFHASVLGGHIEVAQFLLAHGANINSPSANHLAPLLLASQQGHLEIGRWLLSHGADVQRLGWAALHSAAGGGHLEVARMLLQHHAEVNSRNGNGSTPLFKASESGNPDVVRLLLDYNADVHVRDNNGQTPLVIAAAKGFLEISRILLERGVEVNSRDNQGATPFLYASMCGNPALVRLLLDHNADTHVRAINGVTPLHNATVTGNLEVTRILLELNAEVNSRDDNGCTPLHRAIQYLWPGEEFEVVQLLLDSNADPHVCDNKGVTPLHFAAIQGHLEVVRTLLELNVKVNSRDDEGATPFLRASQSGNPDVVRLLLDHNADAYMRNNDGDTPLHCAAIMGNPEVVRILLDRSAEVNSLNNEGSTPLHRASEGLHEGEGGNTDVLRLLLDYGADVQVRNLGGKTASEVARGWKQQEIVQLLSQHTLE